MCSQTITLPSTLRYHRLHLDLILKYSAGYMFNAPEVPTRHTHKYKPPVREKLPAGGSPRQGKAPQGGSRAEPWYLALGTVHTCIPSPYTRWQPPKSSLRRGEAPGKGNESPRQGKAPQGGSRAEPWYLALGTVHTVAQKRQRFGLKTS